MNIICESDCLKIVDLITAGCDHTLHTYATDILRIRDGLRENGNTTVAHVLREQNMCANFMVKEGSHAKCSAHWNCPPPGMKYLIMSRAVKTDYPTRIGPGPKGLEVKRAQKYLPKPDPLRATGFRASPVT